VVDAHADRVSSFAGRLPPFGQGGAQWRVVYRAASAPDPQP
jgi:hypothetical protein